MRNMQYQMCNMHKYANRKYAIYVHNKPNSAKNIDKISKNLCTYMQNTICKICKKYGQNGKTNMHKYAFSKFQNMHFICILYHSMQIYASCA